MPSYRFSDGEVVRWTGLSTCLCFQCREVFSSVSGFDKHRKAGRCREPSEVGLVRNKKGYWSHPPSKLLAAQLQTWAE